MEQPGHIAQIKRHIVRRQGSGCVGQHLRVLGQLEHQCRLGGRQQQRQVRLRQTAHKVALVGVFFDVLLNHRANSRMRVLHIKHRVFVVLLQRQIHIEGVFGVGLAAEQEEAHRVFAGPLNQVAQRHITASAFADLHLLPALHHGDHFVEHVVGVTNRHLQCRQPHRSGSDIGCLQTGAHPRNGAVVVAALQVDGLGVAALELVQVVGHVGQKIGVAAV